MPRGNDGVQGPQGIQGPTGQPFALAVVDGVTTLPPGSAATVSISFDGVNVHFQFGIPGGANGLNGSNGSDGAQGPPGEITAAQLAAAISGTSSNTNAVSTLDTPFTNDPPMPTDLELLRAKLNELILNGRR